MRRRPNLFLPGRRLLKTLAIEGRSIVTVGDHVWFRPGSATGSDGLIEKVEARRGVITRGYRHRQHIIASNVDQVLIVSALAEPGLKLGLIDRYLVSAEMGGVAALIVLNKSDLVDLAAWQWVIGLYTQLGYETIVTSVSDGRGLDRLRQLLSNGVTAVTGQSGVGKSSLLNIIQPGLNLKVREVSDWTYKGKHTTTTAELIGLESGGFVVDTPGLRQFELWGAVPGELGATSSSSAPSSLTAVFPIARTPTKPAAPSRMPCIGGKYILAATKAIASSTTGSRSRGTKQKAGGPNEGPTGLD